MKVKSLVFVFVVLAIFAGIVMPVSANGPTAGTVALTGNMTYSNSGYVSISLNQSSLFMPLSPGSPATNQSLGITVISNSPWQITLLDPVTRPSANDYGHMGNSTGINTITYVAAPLDTILASNMTMTGYTNGTANTGGAVTQPIGQSALAIYTGTGAENNRLLTSVFTQPVAYYDPVLPTSYNYTLSTQFTIAQH
jgi:hypothetical protein